MLKLGFDHIFVRPNQRVARYLANRFFTERGNPKIAWDAGINVAPVSTAIQLNIPLIFYAEHGERSTADMFKVKGIKRLEISLNFLNIKLVMIQEIGLMKMSTKRNYIHTYTQISQK